MVSLVLLYWSADVRAVVDRATTAIILDVLLHGHRWIQFPLAVAFPLFPFLALNHADTNLVRSFFSVIVVSTCIPFVSHSLYFLLYPDILIWTR
jgi:hypothetical protein